MTMVRVLDDRGMAPVIETSGLTKRYCGVTAVSDSPG